MTAGYSGTPLIKKLGIKSAFSIAVVEPPKGYWELLGELPEAVTVSGLEDGSLDFAHLFVTTRAELERLLGQAKGQVKPQGMVWVSWPKRSSGMSSDLTENVIREIALASGLVDVKVCAVDEVWSGLKLVRRLKDR